MSLKRQQDILATFSMASMTDVVFLLLVFFMVTSTFIFPTALEVNLPKSSEQTPLKPTTRVYLEADGSLHVQYGESDPVPCASSDQLVATLSQIKSQDPESAIALYADTDVTYGKVVEILNIGADNDLRMVLATTPRTAADAVQHAAAGSADAGSSVAAAVPAATTSTETLLN